MLHYGSLLPRFNAIAASRATVRSLDRLLTLGDGGILAGSQCRDLQTHSATKRGREERKTYTWETDSAITAFGLRGGFLDVVVDELATGCFDDAPAV